MKGGKRTGGRTERLSPVTGGKEGGGEKMWSERLSREERWRVIKLFQRRAPSALYSEGEHLCLEHDSLQLY